MPKFLSLLEKRLQHRFLRKILKKIRRIFYRIPPVELLMRVKGRINLKHHLHNLENQDFELDIHQCC